MTADAARTPQIAPQRWNRRLKYAPLAIPLLFVLNDAAVFRLDLFVECLARLGMIVLAALMLRGWSSDAKYQRQRLYLFWGLIGFSLDLYWQFAYEIHVAWIAMVIKFAGVAGGTGCFIALCASFANARPRPRVLAFTEYVVAPAFALVMLFTGLLLGFAWQTSHCAATLGPCFVDDPVALWSNRAYFAADSAARLTIVATAVSALFMSPENRQRLLLVALSCIVLAAGTAINFALRLVALPGNAVFALQLLDSVCTFLFVIGLFIAITRRRIFDVAFAWSRTLVSGSTFAVVLVVAIALEFNARIDVLVVGGIIVAIGLILYMLHLREVGGVSRHSWRYPVMTVVFYALYVAVEGDTHVLLDPRFESFVSWLGIVPEHAIKIIASTLIALTLTIALKPLEDRGADVIEERLMAEDGKRAQRLRHFRKSVAFFTQAAELEHMLVDTVFATVQAEFAHLFLRRDDRYFAATVSAPPSAPSPPVIDETALPKPLQPPVLRDGPVPESCGVACEYAALMPLHGQLLGFLGIGRKQCADGSCYSSLILRELHALAHDTAKTLHELRGEA